MTSYRRTPPPSEGESKPSQVRWQPEVYATLKAYATVSNTSMNAVINTGMAAYLARPEVQQAIAAAAPPVTPDSEKLEAVIRRLSGEDA